MTAPTFPDEADKLVLVAQLLADVDLDGIMREVSRADTLGPIVSPTAYRQMLDQGGHLHAVEALALAAIPFRDVYDRLIRPLRVTADNG